MKQINFMVIRGVNPQDVYYANIVKPEKNQNFEVFLIPCISDERCLVYGLKKTHDLHLQINVF
ncbi:hypothetical protein ACQP3D_27430, partial [Escherichia coli]